MVGTTFFVLYGILGETNKGSGEAPKSYTRKEYESATNSIAKRGQGAIAPCRVQGQRPCWGLGQRPNCSASDQSQGSRLQRCRQRSVPASNFALPQERPQAALPQDSVKKKGRSHHEERPFALLITFSAFSACCPCSPSAAPPSTSPGSSPSPTPAPSPSPGRRGSSTLCP